MIKHIVFDVDRTLVDSFEPELLSLQEAIEIVTKQKLEREDLSKLTTLPTSEFFKRLNLSDLEIKQINKEWEITFSKYKTVCFKNIKELIKELNNRGYIIDIITSRTLEEYHELDNELSDISNIINTVITSDIIKNPKPNSESMDLLCSRTNCSKDEIIYVGDSKIDKDFSISSGCLFIPACWENKDLMNEENACFDPIDILKRL